jgi:hypothetical protein
VKIKLTPRGTLVSRLAGGVLVVGVGIALPHISPYTRALDAAAVAPTQSPGATGATK